MRAVLRRKVMSKMLLTEKGFATQSADKGAATVIAGPNGEALPMQLLILPNGAVGGRIVVVPLSERRQGSKDFINEQESLFEIAVNRNQNLINLTINEIDANDLSVKIYETAVLLQSEKATFIESEGMNNSACAKELATSILTDAVNKAMDRSYDPMPERIYFGILDKKTKPRKIEYCPREEKVSSLV